MVLTEAVHHPLVATTAQERELYQKQYTMMGLMELRTIVYNEVIHLLIGIGDRFAPKSMPANRVIDTCNLKI